ncbi:MAG: rhomboid family intramembrane serine protease [Bacteroidota bacterium]
MSSLTPAVKTILFINVALFVAQHFGGLDLVSILGLRYVGSSYFKPYQFFTHLFVHASFAHLFTNMFSLFTFGPVLEHTLNARKFTALYICAGLGAAALYAGIQALELSRWEAWYHHYLANPTPDDFEVYLSHCSQHTQHVFYYFKRAFFEHADDPAYIARSKAIVQQLYTLKADIPVVGASGAIFGLLMAFAMLFPNAALFVYFIPIPVKAKYFMAFYTLYELYAGVQNNPASNVAHFAHVGGVLFGYLFIRWWKQHARW